MPVVVTAEPPTRFEVNDTYKLDVFALLVIAPPDVIDKDPRTTVPEYLRSNIPEAPILVKPPEP